MIILGSGERKANKDHMCNFCGYKIKKGETYNYQNNKHEGCLYTWKSHGKCSAVANHYKMYDECGSEGLMESDFKEHVDEIFNDIMCLSEKVDFLFEKINETK